MDNTVELYIGEMRLGTWRKAVDWMIETFEPGSWEVIDSDRLVSTGPNITLFIMRWL